MRNLLLTVCALIFLLGQPAQAQTVAPISGLGNIQFLDNNGAPLTAGVLYSYQAGTSTPQATYTDSSGLTQNPNPTPFGSGARVQIWLSIGSFYKFVLCSQNDGAACAAGDILFTVDQVPGGSTSSGGSSSSPFISGTANPATSGILRLATSDTVCFRNAAGSTNLCFSKDANDALSWPTALKLPEISAPSCTAGFDYLWADNTSHTLKHCDNGGAATQIASAGNDINVFNGVVQLHFGATPTPLSGTAPTTGQFLQWNGSNIIGAQPEIVWTMGGGLNSSQTLSTGTGTCATAPVQVNCLYEVFAAGHKIVRLTYQLQTSPVTCATAPVVGVYDVNSTTLLTSLTVSNGLGTGFQDSGAISITTTAGDRLALGITTAASGCGTNAVINGLSAILQ